MSELGLGRPTAFILTSDRARAIGFYSDILGFRLVAEDDHGALFDMAGLDVRLTDLPDHVPSPHPSIGFDVADIREVCARLAEMGVRCLIYPGFGQDEAGIWSSPDGATHLAWFNDPDGNVLGLQQKG
jgi:catechol 2,3-dioxygenase-like lactoylglutathione lyase family enzyme